MSAQFANPAQPPSPELIAGLFPLIEGVEIKGVTAPFKNTGKFVNLDGFDLNWGQFVGPIPSKARLTAKMTTPVDATDPSMKALIAAGLDTLSADGDIGAEWTEAARSFVVDVPKLEIGGLLKASARVALANVPRQVFSANAAQAIGAAAQIEAGTIELTVRDLGGVDLGVAQYARAQNVSRDAARKAIVESIMASSTGRGVRQSRCRGRRAGARTLCREPGADADHQADAARQGAGDAACPVVEDRPADRAGAIPDRGFDGTVS